MKVGDYVRRTRIGALAELGDIGIITADPHYPNSSPEVRWLTGRRKTNRPSRENMEIAVTLTDDECAAIMRANLT